MSQAIPLPISLAASMARPTDNARLFEELTRQQRWQQASGRITTALLSQDDSDAVLRMVMSEGRQLVDADEVLITRPVDGHEELLELLGLDGAPTRAGSAGVALPGTVTQLVCDHGPVRTDDFLVDSRFTAAWARHPDIGPMIATALSTQHRPTFAVLIVTRRRGRPAFTDPDRDAITQFAAQVTLSLELARSRTDSDQLQVVRERARIARDMHDHIIGRLFGTGIALQRIARWITDPPGHRQLAARLDDLDGVIRDLRTMIYGLDRDPAIAWSLAARVQQAIDEAVPHLGFRPTLQVDISTEPPTGSATPQHLLAVLREALANVARHAGARSVRVSVSAAEMARLTVTDDGRGLAASPHIPASGGGHGLANMASRAEELGGSLTVETGPLGGTTVDWTAPSARPGR